MYMHTYIYKFVYDYACPYVGSESLRVPVSVRLKRMALTCFYGTDMGPFMYKGPSKESDFLAA